MENEITKTIQKKIEEFERTLLPKMQEGEAYFRSKNTAILQRKKQLWINNCLQNDPYSSNVRVPAGFLKKIIMQKVSYIINEKMTIESKDGDLAERIAGDLGSNFNSLLKKIAVEASKKVYGVLQAYVENNEFKLKKIPSTQIIIVKNKNDHEKIEGIIRYWVENATQFVELYTKDNISTFKKINGQLVLQKTKSHFVKTKKAGGVVTEEQGENWGVVPFAILWNNDEEETDLEPIKTHIDVYDIINSDFVNELIDFSGATWIVKNYSGEDLAEFVTQARAERAINIEGDGDASVVTTEVPVLARKTKLEMTEDDIYKFAMAVRVNKEGARDTNVAIKARFADLDLKASDFEQEVSDCFRQILILLNRFYEITGQETFNVNDVYLKYTRDILNNAIELAELANESVDKISEKTRLESDPRVKNAEEEIKEMDLEKEKELKLLGAGAEFQAGDE